MWRKKIRKKKKTVQQQRAIGMAYVWSLCRYAHPLVAHTQPPIIIFIHPFISFLPYHRFDREPFLRAYCLPRCCCCCCRSFSIRPSWYGASVQRVRLLLYPFCRANWGYIQLSAAVSASNCIRRDCFTCDRHSNNSNRLFDNEPFVIALNWMRTKFGHTQKQYEWWRLMPALPHNIVLFFSCASPTARSMAGVFSFNRCRRKYTFYNVVAIN